MLNIPQVLWFCVTNVLGMQNRLGVSSLYYLYHGAVCSLLLAAVTAEDAQDRSDRAILTPWVKFLWESYRQCLDLLRNNNRVERLYHDIAKQAFDFCLKYTRKTEFRKLCDNVSVC